MDTKICGKCKQRKLLSEFYKSKRDGYRSRCKLCHKMDVKEYFNRADIKERKKARWKIYKKEYLNRPGAKGRLKVYMKEYTRGYRKRPDGLLKIWARNYTNRAIKSGDIKREPCVICGKGQTEAHHLDYGQPWIIMWLCCDCHSKVHKKLKE